MEPLGKNPQKFCMLPTWSSSLMKGVFKLIIRNNNNNNFDN